LVTVWLRDVAYDASRGFLAVGDSGVILSSADGNRWTAQYQPMSVGFCRIRYASGLYIAMGQEFGGINAWSAVLWTSPDGLSWTPRYNATNTVVTGLAAGNEKLIALANVTEPGLGTTAHTLVSTDGSSWTFGASITDRRLSDIAYGNGVYVAVGGNRIVTSADGANWTAASTSALLSLQAITFSQGQFITVGGDGVILTSPDGFEWETRPSGTTAFLSTVAAGTSEVVAAGDSGTVLTSPNGIDWSARAGSRLDIRGLAFGADTFVAVGRYGAIYRSGALSGCGGPRLTLTRDVPHRVGLSGTVGSHYRVEYADQIRGEWKLLSDIASLPASPHEVVDTAPSPTGQRFYRALQLP
jgi:hypothetical protein